MKRKPDGRTSSFGHRDAIRIISAVGRRVAEADTAQLPNLVAIATHTETVIRHTVHDLRLAGYSWAEIGRDLGVTRQAAQHRFGRYLCQSAACPICYGGEAPIGDPVRDFRRDQTDPLELVRELARAEREAIETGMVA